MGKLLFWIVVIVAALFVARLLARHAAKGNSTPSSARRATPAPRDPAPRMARCAHCGIHLPRAEALLLGGDTWCCEEHAKLGARQLD
jgi:uncharacterized protein